MTTKGKADSNMKCTLRKVNEGVVATVDRRPKLNEYYFDTMFQDWVKNNFDVCEDYEDKDLHTIIASTFGVGKELLIQNQTMQKIEVFDFNQPYEYTETETNVIIKL